jgi:hypothetical protein
MSAANVKDYTAELDKLTELVEKHGRLITVPAEEFPSLSSAFKNKNKVAGPQADHGQRVRMLSFEPVTGKKPGNQPGQ